MVARTLLFLGLFGLVPSARAQDAGAADAGIHVESVAEFESHDPFEHDAETEALLTPASDPMAVGADDDPALALPPPTEDELLEPPVRVVHGATLEAIAGVREEEHATEVRLTHGLMVVEESLRFVSTARHRAEVLYRLAVPAGAHVVALRVCNDTGCRDGLTEARVSGEGAYDDALVVRAEVPSGLPVAHVARTDEPTRTFLTLRAAPVTRDRALSVTVRWVVGTRVHGGALRVELPALGADPRTAERAVRVRADDLVEPSIDGAAFDPLSGSALEVPAAQPVLIAALLPRGLSTDVLDALVVPCAAGRCLRVRATGPRPQRRARTVVLAIDASPSTTIGARGRIADAVRVLLGGLPASSRVVAYAFAARAEALSEGPVEPSQVSLSRISDAASADLGASTRFEALVAGLESAGHLTRDVEIVVIGDGGITSSPGSFETWATLRERGVTVSSLNVADRPTTQALAAAVEGAGGVVIDAGPEAASAAESHGDDALAERLAVLFSARARPVRLILGREEEHLGLLRDGEEVTYEGPMSGRSATLRVGEQSSRAAEPDAELAQALTAHLERRTRLVAVDASDVAEGSGTCADDGTRRTRRAHVASSVLGAGRARVALAHRRSCALPTLAEPARARSLPSRPLLTQLRRRVIPVARGCFRDDRRGRADYSTRADIRVTFADREIVETQVEGPITPELASCLAAAFDGLDIPAFDGTVVVHWPLYTAAEPPPPTLELAPDVSRAIDRIAGE